MIEEEGLHRFGTPLEPLEKDEVPAKKPVAIEDQIVTDENGRRRFHGAFTGGFSAGFWNTVGSLEGWTPQNFKSSRHEKATQRQQQRPEDFMDQEDLGEFGIAPQRVQAREEFARESKDGRKRKLMQPSAGPIPGAPVLQQLLHPVKDKVAVRILKSMGWRPGQGIGPRQTRKEKKKAQQRNQRELYLLQRYGCELADENAAVKSKQADVESDESDDDEEDDDDITFAPDDYEPFVATIKDNRYGLDYTGLSREPVLSKGKAIVPAQHINLFGPLEVLTKNDKKLSISGQAFGVGALEEEDDDIYERDDMTKYDFSLGDRKQRKKTEKHVQDRRIIDGFLEPESKGQYNAPFSVELPRDYTPRNWAVRRSRFAPLDPTKVKELNLESAYKKSGLGRHDLSAGQRGELLGEHTNSEPITSTQMKSQAHSKQMQQEQVKSKEEKTKELLARITAKSSNFTRGGIITAEGEEKSKETQADIVATAVQQEQQELLAKASNKTKNMPSTVTSGTFKPFLGDDAKQERYEQFLVKNLQAEDEISVFLATIQPVHLSEWDREMEKKEFIQARKIYKPLGGIMSDRFVSETAVEAEKTVIETKSDAEKKLVMERTKTMWKPSSLLCKRYNIAEPFGGAMIEEKQPKKSKMSVFDYLETSINSKATFHTPVIIPKHIEKPKAIISDKERAEKVISIEKVASTKASAEQAVPTIEASAKHTANEKKPTTTRYVPKTDLEKRIEESKDKPVHEKTELFKAIFDDSDDEEEKATESELKETENAETVPPSLLKPTTAAAANLLRNTSPPRGIFAALFTTPAAENAKLTDDTKQENSTHVQNATTTIPKIAFKPKSARLRDADNVDTAAVDATADEQTTTKAAETAVYGPKVPAHIPTTNMNAATTTAAIGVDDQIMRLLEKQKSFNVKIDEEWVEKTFSNESSSESGSSESSTDKRNKKKTHKTKKRHKNKEHERKHKKKDKKKSKKHNKSHKSKKIKRK